MEATSNSTNQPQNNNFTGGIVRGERPGGWTSIPRAAMEDDRLSWEARGVLAYLLVKPDNWVVRNNDLVARGPAGRDKIKRVLRELRETGYLKRARYRRSDGTFVWVSQVLDEPTIGGKAAYGDLSIDALSVDGSPVDGKPVDIVNTNKPNTNKNKSITKEKDEQAEIQELGFIVKVDLGGTGDQARLARQLYFEHREELSLQEIAEMAMEE